MSRLTILAINAKYVHSSLAAWVIASGVREYAQKTHEVSIVEATIHHSNEEITERIAAHMPDVVGISTYIWNAGKLPELMALIKERLPGVRIIMGGPEAAYNAQFWLSRGAEHVLTGDGEYEVPAWLDGRDGDYEPYGSDRHDGSYEPRHPVPCFPGDEYIRALEGRLAYIETSRGCPFSCAFCLSADTSVRFFPMEMVKEQLTKLSKSGARTIKLVDRTFNCHRERAYEIFEYVISLGTECCFHFEVAADLFDEKTLNLLKTAAPGRIQFEAGLQSFFGPTLEASSRQTDLSAVERNVSVLMSGGNIHMHVDLIAGLPYETLKEFRNSFERAYALKAHTLQLGFLKLLHGSKLRSRAHELGIEYSQEPPYEIRRSPWLSPQDIEVLKQAENALQHTYNKSRFLTSLEYVLRSSGLKPFELYHKIGIAAPNHGTDLPAYAGQIIEVCAELSGVEHSTLLDHMAYDWMGMVKGKNMPAILRNTEAGRSGLIKVAEKNLGRKIRRDEATVLLSGKGLYVDSEKRNPVTGLYEVYEL
ncbi:MAG: B12-binding domain-containing radical SAM protein [Oscillospiraceae bacterium]|nr:B12-binding domain-containing radical SAM protein [Oscillospiraceae bacterium]